MASSGAGVVPEANDEEPPPSLRHEQRGVQEPHVEAWIANLAEGTANLVERTRSRQQPTHVFEQDTSGLAAGHQPNELVEELAAWVVEELSTTSVRKALARKAGREDIVCWHLRCHNAPYVAHRLRAIGPVTLVCSRCKSTIFASKDTLPPCSFQRNAETADAREALSKRKARPALGHARAVARGGGRHSRRGPVNLAVKDALRTSGFFRTIVPCKTQ
jgi:hypothetical protein